MSAFTSVIVIISKTKTKRLTVGKKSARNIIYLVSSCIFFDVCFDFEADVVVDLEIKKRNIFPPRCPPCCLLWFSHEYIWHFRWTKWLASVGCAIVCNRLWLYGNSFLCDRMRSAICDPRSCAIVCDHMETSLYPLHVTVALIVKITPKFSRQQSMLVCYKLKTVLSVWGTSENGITLLQKKNPSYYTIL